MATRRERNPRGAGSRLRDDLVAAASRLLEDHGEPGLTMRAVTRAVGAAPQSMYAHFADREDLLWAVLRVWFAELEDVLRHAVPDDAPAPSRVRTRALALCRYGLDHPRRYRLLLDRDGPAPAGVPVEEFPGARVFGLLQDDVQSALAASATGRAASRGADAFVTTTDLLAALHGMVLLRVGLPSFPWPPLDGAVDRAADAILSAAA
ncbi:MAG: TetR/AcrR family transcriptional regulator [Dermatophilaceae bacterium]